MQLIEVVQGVDVLLRVIQARVVLLVCMLLTFGLFCWAMWQQTVIAVILCVAWGLLIFLPVLWRDRGGTSGLQEASQHTESPSPPG